jgi:hypothetical protein
LPKFIFKDLRSFGCGFLKPDPGGPLNVVGAGIYP